MSPSRREWRLVPQLGPALAHLEGGRNADLLAPVVAAAVETAIGTVDADRLALRKAVTRVAGACGAVEQREALSRLAGVALAFAAALDVKDAQGRPRR